MAVKIPAGLVTFAKKESKRLHLGTRNEDDPFGDDDLSYVEHLMHEVAHAMLLGIPVQPGFSRKVSGVLSSMYFGQDVWEETKTWGVEWQAAMAIGVPLHLGDVIDAATIQGCDEQDVRDALVDPELEPYALQLVDYMTMGGRLR